MPGRQSRFHADHPAMLPIRRKKRHLQIGLSHAEVILKTVCPVLSIAGATRDEHTVHVHHQHTEARTRCARSMGRRMDCQKNLTLAVGRRSPRRGGLLGRIGSLACIIEQAGDSKGRFAKRQSRYLRRRRSFFSMLSTHCRSLPWQLIVYSHNLRMSALRPALRCGLYRYRPKFYLASDEQR